MIGDFNINVLNKTSSSFLKFNNVLIAFGVKYLVDFPTRITESTASAIDNCLSNMNNLKVTGIITELSDHDAQLVEITHEPFESKLNLNNNCKQVVRRFSKSNKEVFQRAVAQESWMEVYQATVDTKYEVFLNCFLYYFNLYFPKTMSKINSNRQLQWINREIQDIKKEVINLSVYLKRQKQIILSLL